MNYFEQALHEEIARLHGQPYQINFQSDTIGQFTARKDQAQQLVVRATNHVGLSSSPPLILDLEGENYIRARVDRSTRFTVVLQTMQSALSRHSYGYKNL